MAKLPMPFTGPTTYPGHSGIDFPEAKGTPIPASGSGKITYRGWLNDRAGYSTIVAYDGGPAVLYCHQPHTDAIPAVGSRVGAGSQIGVVGSSGNSTGPHLHMEIMEGAGAHTDAGVWIHFDQGAVVGSWPARARYGAAWVTKGQKLLNAVGFDLDVDGKDGPATQAAVRTYQKRKGLTVDGILGPDTMGKLEGEAGTTAPAYPLPAGSYFGPKTGPVQSVSGYYSHRADLKRWQARMAERGWKITADGLYGDQTASVARAFQKEKGLAVDALIGPKTWRAAWELPVT